MAAGDFYIRRNSADTSSVPNAGTNLDLSWDTEYMDEGGIGIYTNPNIQLNIGLYLIMYSDYFNTADVTNNERIEIQSEIHISGTGAVGGYGQGYIRKSSGDQEATVRGSMILQVTSNNTDIFIRTYRTDNSTTGTVDRVIDVGSISILELDDATHNFGLYSSSASEVTSGTTVRTLTTNTNDKQDTGFSNSSGIITITTAGRYLCMYNMNISQAGTGREVVSGFIEKNSTTEVIGTRGYCYMRGADGTQDGALNWIGIIDVAANDTLRVRYSAPTSVTITTAAGAKFQLWQIPSVGDECIMEATTGDYNAEADFAWDTLPHIDVASFTATAGNSNIDVDQNDHLLVFATFAQVTDSSVQRAVPFITILNNGTDDHVAAGGEYHRNSSTSNFSCNVSGLIPNFVSGTGVNIYTSPRAATGALANIKGQFSVLSLESIWNYTYTFTPNITDFDVDEHFNWGETGLITTGTSFGATKGTGKIEFWSDLVGTIKTTQTDTSWSDTSITINTVQGSLSSDTTLYLVVTNDGGKVSTPFSVSNGIESYISVRDSLLSDHDWVLDNTYNDTGNTGPTRDMTSGVVGAQIFVASPICDDTTYTWRLNSITDRREIADSPNMNITVNSKERTLDMWFMIGGIQQSLSAIWKEGGGIQNLAFLMGMGNKLVYQLADSATTRDNVQVYSDILLTPNRPYHAVIRYTHLQTTKETTGWLDGRRQSVDDGNPMILGIFDSHSGDVTWGDPDTNLEMGTVDITFDGQVECYISCFGTWSDNSTNGGFISDADILSKLFRRGALPKYTIASGTEAVMQSDLDTQLANSEVEDWPLGIRVSSPTGNGDIELIVDNITFNERTSDHLEWRGSGVLTWVLKNGSLIDDTNKIFSSAGGSVVIANDVLVKITVKDIDTNIVVQNARVLLGVNTGGDLPFEDIVTITSASGAVTSGYFDASDDAVADPDNNFINDANFVDGDWQTQISAAAEGSETVRYIGAGGTDITGLTDPEIAASTIQVRVNFIDSVFSYESPWVALNAPAVGDWTLAKLQALEFRFWLDTLSSSNTWSFDVYENGDSGGTGLMSTQGVYTVQSGAKPAIFQIQVVESVTATVTHTAHGLSTGDMILIADANEDAYNGSFTIIVTDINTYTYPLSDAPSSPATGTIKATNILIQDITDVNGEIFTYLRYTNDQPVIGRVRRATTGTFYQTSKILTTITNNGIDIILYLIKDE